MEQLGQVELFRFHELFHSLWLSVRPARHLCGIFAISGSVTNNDPVVFSINVQKTNVGVADLLQLLGAWGACPKDQFVCCPADLDDDSTVGVSDLLALLSNRG